MANRRPCLWPSPVVNRRKDRAKWTLQLLATTLVANSAVDTISDETERRLLKKDLNPRLKHHRCIATVDADYVLVHGERLDLYALLQPHATHHLL